MTFDCYIVFRNHLGLNLKIFVQDEATVLGFEVPNSPDSSYKNVYPGNEDEGRDPPLVPPHLQHTVLSCPSRDDAGSISTPHNVILNHLYIENREAPRSVVALGYTHRFRSKFVTVVLYKPVQRRGNTRAQKCFIGHTFIRFGLVVLVMIKLVVKKNEPI